MASQTKTFVYRKVIKLYKFYSFLVHKNKKVANHQIKISFAGPRINTQIIIHNGKIVWVGLMSQIVFLRAPASLRILLNVTPPEIESLRTLDDLAALRARRGSSFFTIAPHPFYVLGGSLGGKLVERIDCFDAIELCHFWTRWFNPNRRAVEIAARFRKPLIATSDAHRLHAFGSNYTSIPGPAELTVENVIEALRSGVLRVKNPPCSFVDLISTIYFVFVAHPWRRRKKRGRRTED